MVVWQILRNAVCFVPSETEAHEMGADDLTFCYIRHTHNVLGLLAVHLDMPQALSLISTIPWHTLGLTSALKRIFDAE